jgi:hypothetical protein
VKLTSGLFLVIVALVAAGCGGGKRRAEHAKVSVLPGAAPATAAEPPPAAKRCQVSGFAYTVPAPGPVVAAGAP